MVMHERRISIDSPFYTGAFFAYGSPGAPIKKYIEVSKPSYEGPAMEVILEVPSDLVGRIDKGVIISQGLHKNMVSTIGVLDEKGKPIADLEQHDKATIRSSSKNVIQFDIKKRGWAFSIQLYDQKFDIMIGEASNFGLILGGFGYHYNFGRLLNASTSSIFAAAPFVLTEPIRD